MNLLCPNCQKMLQVPDQFAGQMMKCPLCAGTFTVPSLAPTPSAPPPPPPPPMPGPEAFQAAPPPGAGYGAPPPPPAGYTHARSISANPRIVPWIAPLSLIVVFLLLFFPWIGIYPGGIGGVTQNGWQVAFGSYSTYNVWEKYNESDKDALQRDGVGISIWTILYILIFIPAMLVAIASALIHMGMIPAQPALAPFLSFRSLVVGALALVTLVLLVLQLAIGFPVESRVLAIVNGSQAISSIERPNPTDEDRIRLDMERGKEMGKYNIRTTSWLSLVLVLNLLAVIGAGLDLWLERRGPRPVPRLELLY